MAKNVYVLPSSILEIINVTANEMSSEFMNACDIKPTSSLFVKIGLPLKLLKPINELPEVTVSPWLIGFPGRPTLLNKSNWYVAWQPRKH